MGGPQRIVVVADREAENREHGVADELLPRSAVGLDRLDHRQERRIDLVADVLGVVLGHEPDVIHEIGEECGDDPPIAPLDVAGRRCPTGLRGFGNRRPALIAELRRASSCRPADTAAHPGDLLPSPLDPPAEV